MTCNKNSILLFFIFLKINFLYSQKNIGITFQKSFEKVKIKNYNNFMISSTSFMLNQDIKQVKLSYGLQIQESITGDFGGLYVFGIITQISKSILRSPLYVNFNSFFGGGGGAGAPDGSGYSRRLSYGLSYQIFDNLNLILLRSNYSFPNGEINSNNNLFGISYINKSIFNSKISNARFINQGVGFYLKQINIDKNDSYLIDKSYSPLMIGFEYNNSLSNFYNDKLNFLLRLEGLISQKNDGFMAFYKGLSYEIFKYFDFNFLIGSSGGGGIETDGGLSYIIEPKLKIPINSNILSLSYGLNKSIYGNFSSDFIQFSLNKKFSSSIRILNNGNMFKTYNKDTDYLIYSFGINYYEVNNNLDKNGLKYVDIMLSNFSLKYQIKNSYLIGSTKWAFFGNYGAYAEGLLGYSQKLISFNKVHFYIPIYLVVAGGGGINVGKGYGFQISSEIKYDFNDNISLGFEYSKLNMINGSFNPNSYSISLIKKLKFYKIKI